MLSSAILSAALLPAVSAETVLGVYMFHRHGDRTAKMTPPANLTNLGYQEVFTSGDYYRNRYVASNATSPILGINDDIVKQSQLAVSAPADTVLQNSATGFLQGLYPPVGASLGTQTLRNDTNVTSPLQGYQLIPISLVSSGTGSEDNGWLQSASGCGAATTSSNEYFSSTPYMDLLSSTQDFYNGLSPVINGTFSSSQTSFKNAYTIYDLINVAEIHNGTNFNSPDLITPDVFQQLRTLADTHEWNLGYNSSNNARAIAGMTLAGQIVQGLNGTLTSNSSPKLNVQFGAYGSFGSFFGLAGLQNVDPMFYGVADYASAMTFELVTNASVTGGATSVSDDDVAVRFLWHNGTTSDISPPAAYPLFGSSSTEMPWTDFVNNMNGVSVGSTEQWCNVCQNTTGTCAAYAGSSANGSSGSSSTTQNKSSGNSLSPAVNGVIGAMVTLAVVLGIEALVLLAGGFRVVSKKALAGGASAANGVEPKA